jgi:hypothetical protein
VAPDWNSNVTALLVIASTLWLSGAFIDAFQGGEELANRLRLQNDLCIAVVFRCRYNSNLPSDPIDKYHASVAIYSLTVQPDK